MAEVLEGYVDDNGEIRLPGHPHLIPGQRVVVTVAASSGCEAALLSEAALARDWSRPEEDDAWSHLQPAP